MRQRKTHPPRQCIAVIADVVNSRRFKRDRRQWLQDRLQEMLDQLNQTHRNDLLSKFSVTVGDEFQGLLARAEPVADLIREFETAIPKVCIRLGVGCGLLETERAEFAIGMDGSVWHAAREAVITAKTERKLGGVFRGFGDQNDILLDGFARLLYHTISRFTDRQRQIYDLLQETPRQSHVAERLNVGRATINQQAKAIGWHALKEGEKAWKELLKRFDYSDRWRSK